MSETPLDLAYRVSERSDADRLRYYAALADTELYVLLTKDPVKDDISPRVFPLEGQDYVMAFDTDARLADFAKGMAPYAALPGRVLAQVLSEAGLGLGINLDVAPSSNVLPPDALKWLVSTLDTDMPDVAEAQLRTVEGPGKVPDILLEALGARLTVSAGLAKVAVLVRAEFASGQTGYVLAIIGAKSRAEPALARAVSEALTFSGVEAGYLDVAFIADGTDIAEKIQRVGLRFDIPQPQPPEARIPAAPGSDPAQPPKLR
ncbi:MAG: SseB family protein [Paracoccaceae bacterium]